MKKFVFVFICLLAVISCSRKENKADQPVAKEEKPVANEIDTKNFKPENVSKLFYNKDLKTINLLFEDKDFFENFSKTPYAVGVVMSFFSDEVFQPYIDKLKKSNLPVMEDPSCLLSAIVNREFDCIPWLIEQGLSPYEYVDYGTSSDMNTFDCIHWQEKLVRMGSTYDAENKVYILSKEEKESIEKFEEVRKLLTEYTKEMPAERKINSKTFKPENVEKLFHAKELELIDLLFEDKDFFENFSKTPYAIAVVMRFFPDKVFSQYVEKLKESNLPVKENKVCLLDAIVNMESDCIPWLLEQGLSPYDVVDYNGTEMNAFDCVDWQENNIRTWNTPYKERYINTLKEIRKLLTEGVKKL
ncbi:MAG TPA: hypothetical protein DCP61_03165 [Treponema sp.]|nr:hypothetical protein [Treponema sp.]